jgi:quercetin dioxygenase-like cupin family protein
MTDSNPPKAMPGVSLRVLNKVDGPIAGYETVMVELEIPAGTFVGRHSHPGIESTYIIGGSGELTVDGRDGRLLKPGDAFQVSAGTVHSVKIGDRDAKACSVLVVEKGKPLVAPAP